MVISDHGFSSFRRGVNLNAWLLREGYLALKRGHGRHAPSGCATWTGRRRAPTPSGLTGLFLNLKGREAQGIVDARGRGAALKAEIIAQARAACATTRSGDVGINEAFDTAALYDGPYLRERAGPDHRLQRRLPHLVGLRHRHGVGPGLRGQRQGRGAATTASTRGSCPACSSATARSTRRASRRSSTSRPPRCASSASQPPPHMDGRPLGRRGVGVSTVVTAAPRRCRRVLTALAAARPSRRCRAACGRRTSPPAGAVIVLGFDGLDYDLTRR